jgi:hypothetical protein
VGLGAEAVGVADAKLRVEHVRERGAEPDLGADRGVELRGVDELAAAEERELVELEALEGAAPVAEEGGVDAAQVEGQRGEAAIDLRDGRAVLDVLEEVARARVGARG